jgi:predicted nucleic acid-binding protein
MASFKEEVYYLDTSALIKRYVVESGSNMVDKIFENAYRGTGILSFSYWNIAEAIVVFDKYERRLGLKAKDLLRNLLREVKTLSSLNRVIVIDVAPSILRIAIKLVLKHHIYVADALQIASAIRSSSSKFVTSDKDLANIARVEGLETIYVG